MRALLLWMTFVLISPAAAVPLAVDAELRHLSLSDALVWLPETAATGTAWSLADVRQHDADFVALADNAALGYVPGRAPGAHWFRVALRETAGIHRELLLSLPFDKLDLVDAYIVDGAGSTTVWRTGSTRTWDTRPVATSGFVFPLTLAAGDTATIYLRIVGQMGVLVPLELYAPAGYAETIPQVSWWQGLFYGLALGILGYNAFLWYSTRDRAFLYFVLAGAAGIGYFAGYDNLGYRYWPEAIIWQQYFLFMCGSLSAALTMQFVRHLADTSTCMPKLDRVLRALVALALVATGVMVWLPLPAALAITVLVSVLMTLLALTVGMQAWRMRIPLAPVLVVAMGLHLILITMVGVASLALVPGWFDVAMLAHRVGLAFELSLFSFVLGERLKRVSAAHHRAREEALEARANVHAQNEFMAKMSHELRTPMTGVLGMAELLEHTELAPQQRRYLSTLRYSGEMLLHLINDILDHARIESGRLKIRREAFDLLRLVDECRLLFDQQPRNNSVVMRTDIGGGLSRAVVGDAQRVRQVLVNLLANAFKFTQQGSVTLRVLALPQPGWVRFEVEDTGIGIAPEDTAHLFQVFSQLKPAGTGSRGGVGLGLAICRQLCELMGGRIGVESEPGRGALFWFELPLHASG